MEAPFNWGKDLDPTCEPQLLSIGDRMFSTNLGMSSYEVTSITRYQDDASTPISMPSVLYLNNTLENCVMESVVLELRKNDFAKPQNAWWISWSLSSYATATARCTVMSETSPSNITLQTRYSGAGDGKNFAYLISDNYTTRASAWWGSRLLNVYWSGVLTTMASANLSASEGFSRTPRGGRPSGILVCMAAQCPRLSPMQVVIRAPQSPPCAPYRS